MPDPVVVVQVIENTVVVEEPITHQIGIPIIADVKTIGIPGPQGPPGQSGGTFQSTAGATISAYTAVSLVGGLLYPADPTNSTVAQSVVGVSIQGGLTGATINYQDAGSVGPGTFSSGAKHYVGLNGQLVTTIPPQAVWKKSMGVGESSTTLAVILGPSILL